MSQFLANTLLTASIVMLVGIGFAAVYQVCRFFHFAHGGVLVVGAYTNWALKTSLSLPLAISVPCAILVSAGLGCLIEIVVYRPLRRRKASAIAILLASLGVYIALINAMSLTFGDQTKTLRDGSLPMIFDFWGARVTAVQVTTISVALSLVAALLLVTRFTLVGKMFRAASEDPTLARAVGINVPTLVLAANALGAAIGGLAGILISLDVDLRPTMAFSPLLLAAVAVVVGGVGDISGVALGALLVALLSNSAGWYLGHEWGQPATFLLLVVFLVLRPRGFVGATHRPILQD